MALDQATTAFLEQMAKSGGKPLHEMSPKEARGFSDVLRGLFGKGPAMTRVEDVRIQTPTGDFPVRVLVPTNRPRGAIVWIHGGGWVIGGIEDSDTLARQLAKRTGCSVVNVDYRLAPEHRFPVAADDAYAALEWTAQNLSHVAAEGAPILVGGDSAGGNLSAVVARRARDGKGPKVALQLLVYPVTDADFERPTYIAKENQLLLTRDTMVWFWDHYAPDRAARSNPDASPLRAKDLTGLPPAVVFTAEHDVLRDEGEAYAKALIDAGVPVTFQRFEGQMHGFFTMVGLLPAAATALELAARAIDAAISPAGGAS